MKLCTNWRWKSRKPISSGAELISVESVNAEEGTAQALRGRQFAELQEYLQTVDSAATAPISPELLKPSAPTKMPLRIHASDQLNSDGAKRPLSLVIKVYKLKAYEDFMRAPYDAFAQAPYKADEPVVIAHSPETNVASAELLRPL